MMMDTRTPKPSTTEDPMHFNQMQEDLARTDEKDFPVLPRFCPTVDFAESEKAFYIQMDIRGIKKEDIKIRFSGNQLLISGERKWTKNDDGRFFHILETRFGTFCRSFSFSDNVEPDRMEVDFEHGVLNVTVPKRK